MILRISLHQHHTAAGQSPKQKRNIRNCVTKNVKIFPLQESGSLFVKFWFTPTLFNHVNVTSTAYSGVDVVSDEPYLHNRQCPSLTRAFVVVSELCYAGRNRCCSQYWHAILLSKLKAMSTMEFSKNNKNITEEKITPQIFLPNNPEMFWLHS